MTTLTDPPTVRATATTPVAAVLAEHFDADPVSLPVVSMLFEHWDHVNTQAALDAFLAAPGRTSRAIGATVPLPPGGSPLPPEAPVLADLLTAADARIGAPVVVALANGPDSTAPCLDTALVLADDDEGPIAIYVRGDSPLMGKRRAIEVQAPTAERAGAVLDELARLTVERSWFKGQVVRFSVDIYRNVRAEFDHRPQLEPGALVLPAATQAAIEEHAIGIAQASADLEAAGRHLKRGILLYGPPGTGKTLTIRHLISSLPDATVFVLTGSNMAWLRFVVERAAGLAPAIIVLDDVDLIAEDRNLGGMSPRRHLFDLLDSMDGIDERGDVLFVATTNRPEAIERAVAARPGRVDQAVEVGLPDPDCRLRLIELYGRGLDLRVDDLDGVVARTEGVTASFIKELLRRAAVLAVIDSPDDTDGPVVVTDAEIGAALDTLLDPANPITASLLGGAATTAVPTNPTEG